MSETYPGVATANQRPRGWNPFRILRARQAYRAIFYFILGIPLALVYFYVAGVTFTSYGAQGSLPGLLVVIALALTLGWGLVWVERGLASWLLGTRFTPIAPPLPPEATAWERFKDHFRNPVTWKSLIYLAARVPAGGLGLLALGLFGASLALVLGPLVAIIAPLSTADGVYNFLINLNLSQGAANVITNLVVGTDGIPALLAPIPGVALALLGLWFFEGLGRGWSWFARQTLGISPVTLQLAEARVMVVEARGRAARAEEDRRRLILDASHELRTPVATVRAYLDSLLLLENERLDEPLRQYLGVMQREIERLGLLVDDLLMLARADADKLRLDVRPISVGAVVEEVYQAMAPLAERERQVTLVRQFADGGLPLAYADSARLAQALMNLVRNAITHTPAGGLVSVDLAPGAGGDVVAITVTDTGEGVSDDELPHLFERFYRADAARARDTGGFGLGLSIVRDLVEAMGGTVSAGRAPEGGARFQITLRAATAAPASVA